MESQPSKPRLLLILGCQRSGTSILAAMLGRHPEINMLYESQTRDVIWGYGKEYNANKLLAWHQVRISQRASRVGFLINRLVNLDLLPWKPRYQKIRLYPTSRMSIKDYLDRGAKIIYVTRDEDDVVESMKRRSGMSDSQIRFELRKASEIFHALEGKVKVVQYKDLVDNPENQLRDLCAYLGLDFDMKMLEGHQYNWKYSDEAR